MQYTDCAGEIEITGVTDFDPIRIFECGQCFRWNADESGVYTGVAQNRAARLHRVGKSVRISGSTEDFETIWRSYFDLDLDYEKIRRQLCIDDFMQKATDFGAGIRILRQDKWEALCSFIISQCNNIPRIKRIIDTLCREFGNKIEFENKTYYTFPAAEVLAPLYESDLAPLRCGYRASYIISAAKAVAEGTLDLEELSRQTAETAREKLKHLHGVGNKVADCAILFGLNMLDAFPQDVWIKRAIAEQYGKTFDPKIFTPYAGIAQQYIFYYTRSKNTCNH
jgi:N-glycosylase/DNA lyase